MTFALVLAVVGLLLIYLEFFVPGGVLALIGGGLLIGSLVFFALQHPGILLFVGYAAALTVAAIYVCKLALWRVKMSGSKKTFYLDKDQEGYQAAQFDKTLIGKKGTAATDMRPSGHVVIDGVSWQAVSESGYVAKGSEVLVIRGEGGHLVVR
jgi:membrane-bound serine protease (ClpP class)